MSQKDFLFKCNLFRKSLFFWHFFSLSLTYFVSLKTRDMKFVFFPELQDAATNFTLLIKLQSWVESRRRLDSSTHDDHGLFRLHLVWPAARICFRRMLFWLCLYFYLLLVIRIKSILIWFDLNLYSTCPRWHRAFNKKIRNQPLK